MRVWLAGAPEQAQVAARHAGRPASTARAASAYLGGISRAAEELGDVDFIWYIRSKVALLFEVEWTAMLGEPLLVRHARFRPDKSLVRFLVIAPGRTGSCATS